jgi:hypothetical protein
MIFCPAGTQRPRVLERWGILDNLELYETESQHGHDDSNVTEL